MKTAVIEIAKIKIEKNKARHFDTIPEDPEFLEFAASIKKNLIHQLTVTEPDADGFHTLKAGHRRLKALRFNKRLTVPVNILEPGDDADEIALQENTHRKDPSVGDQVKTIQRQAADGRSLKDISFIFGKSVEWVRSYSGMINLIDDILILVDVQTVAIGIDAAQYSHEAQRVTFNRVALAWIDAGAADEDTSSDKTSDITFKNKDLRRRFMFSLNNVIKRDFGQPEIKNMPWPEESEEHGARCAGCIHRSETQQALFSEFMEINSGRCQNLACYAKKMKSFDTGMAENFEGITINREIGYEVRDKSYNKTELAQLCPKQIEYLIHSSEAWSGMEGGRHGNSDISFRARPKKSKAEKNADGSGNEPAASWSVIGKNRIMKWLFLQDVFYLWKILTEIEPNLDGPASLAIITDRVPRCKNIFDSEPLWNEDRAKEGRLRYILEDWKADDVSGTMAALRFALVREAIIELWYIKRVKKYIAILDPGLKRYKKEMKAGWSAAARQENRKNIYDFQTKADLARVAEKMDVIVKSGPKANFVQALAEQTTPPAWFKDFVFVMDPDQGDATFAGSEDRLSWFELNPTDFTGNIK